jgi:prevent-host-death family protein
MGTMSEIGAYEAKTHLSRLLDEVEAGATITITRNGRPVARLIRVTDAKEAADRILALRAGVSKGKLSMRALIEEGRRK